MYSPVDALSHKQFPDLIIYKDHNRVGYRWNHEVRDCNRAGEDRGLHERHIYQKQADADLEQK
jgi:hypothetical protein